MANGSRPRKSSQSKTSSRGLSPKGTVPVSTGAPNRSSRKSVKPPKLDPLELYVTLIAGEEDLSVNAARALLRLRRAQLAARDGAKGAIIKLELHDGATDLMASAAASPLLGDFFSLIALELIECFPARAATLRKLLAARRAGLDLSQVIAALWEEGGADSVDAIAALHRVDGELMAACAWVSAKPILESIAAGLVRHRKAPLPPSEHCPVCGGRASARQGKRLLCASCESKWPAPLGDATPAVDADLEPFDTRPLVALLRELDAAPRAKSALQSPRG